MSGAAPAAGAEAQAQLLQLKEESAESKAETDRAMQQALAEHEQVWPTMRAACARKRVVVVVWWG